ncbi:MAG: biotin--[acetyl-CoA-carboxylase] ligase [Candidatus Binatia bacterium]
MDRGFKTKRDETIGPFGAPLEPDKIQKGLLTARLGNRIHYLLQTDSTNAYARKLAQEGAVEGEVVIAEAQVAGKGRMGRSWVSPPGVNLYLSVILRPRLSPVHAPQLTLMAAVALAETVWSFISFPPEIKWPNDILVGGKKLAGILAESSCETHKILFVVVGIGVNLNYLPERMPAAIKQSATSIMALMQMPVDRIAFTRRLIQDLDQCYGDLEAKGFASVAPRWESFCRLKGQKVRVTMIDRSIIGKAMGIDDDGALILKDEGGARHKILVGDVIPIDR